MNIFKSELFLKKGKASFEKLLNERLVSLSQESFYIFPFALFKKEFFKDFKQSRKGVFTGKIIGEHFEIFPTSKVFSTRTWFPLRIVGIIDGNKINVRFIIPDWIIGIVLMLTLTDLILIKKEMELNGTLFAFVGIIILSYVYKIHRYNRIIKYICN
jgi:hypothetical protein